MRGERFKPWRDYLENILVAVVLAICVRNFVLSGYKVPTTSMAPTLRPGDFIFAYRPPFGLKVPFSDTKVGVKPPKRGDVVVFTYPEQPNVNYVKRVVGLPGDRIKITDGQLTVNDEKATYKSLDPAPILDLPGGEMFELFEESLLGHQRQVLFQKERMKKNFGPLIVPPGEIFLLGDHRDSSDDSRYWGTVPLERIEGKVLVIWLSLNWQKKWGGERFPSLREERVFSAVR